MGNACGCADKRTTIEKQIDQTLYMLRRMPSLSRYALSKERNLTFTSAWNSSIYGYSVLNPLGAPMRKRTRHNPLEQQIKDCQINALYGGGYYCLEKVQLYSDDSHFYVDIYMLIDSIDNQEELKAIQDSNNRYLNSLLPKLKQVKMPEMSTTKPGNSKGGNFLKFDDIKDSLNGYGRIIHYKSNNSNPDPQYNELEKIEEGQFRGGLKDGYCRSISAINGQTAAGFHSAGVANGKWTSYNKDGTFSHPQGIYEGSTCTTRLEIASFKEKITKTNP